MGHYERISVGDKIKELATNEIMIRMSFDSSIGWKLVVGFPEIRKEENDAFIYGDLLAAFTVVMDTPFFLFSFGGGPWMDTPFEPRIDASLPSFDIQLDDGDGLGLLVMSVDTKYGEVKGFRQVGLGHGLSMKILSVMQELQQRPPITQEEHRRNIERAYRTYGLPEDMLRTVKPDEVFAIINT